MTEHRIGTAEEHLQARLALLEAEKEHSRRGDDLARQRQALPWVPVEKEYVFDSDAGERTLLEAFEGRSQLLAYHFMFGPEWSEGCPLCSYWADSFNGGVIHLAHRDVTMVCVSRLRSSSSRPTSGGWGGASRGCPRGETTSTATSASLCPV
jgi:predicted dithiol-disulfide oxidoreductase (DUF899 family)